MSVTYSRSFRKIQICNLRNGALLTFWLKLFIHKSSLHRVACTKSVRELEEISLNQSYLSLESSKSCDWAVTASSCIYEKCLRIERNELHIVRVFEELVSQNTVRRPANSHGSAVSLAIFCHFSLSHDKAPNLTGFCRFLGKIFLKWNKLSCWIKMEYLRGILVL